MSSAHRHDSMRSSTHQLSSLPRARRVAPTQCAWKEDPCGVCSFRSSPRDRTQLEAGGTDWLAVEDTGLLPGIPWKILKWTRSRKHPSYPRFSCCQLCPGQALLSPHWQPVDTDLSWPGLRGPWEAAAGGTQPDHPHSFPHSQLPSWLDPLHPVPWLWSRSLSQEKELGS